MKRRNLLVFAVLTAAMLVAGSAFAGGPVDKATGGGQVLLTDPANSEETVGGAGSTIAFNARQTGEDFAADGQVQFVKRFVSEKNGKGTGKGGQQSHGRVLCLEVVGNTAWIAGVWTSGFLTGNFELFVQDNGEGSSADNDLIAILEQDSNPACDQRTEDGEESVDLARGNAQVHDADSE